MLKSSGALCLLAVLSVTALHDVSAAASNPARVRFLGHKPQQHTSATFLRRTIVKTSSSKMTDAEKKAVLDMHNELRSKRNATYQPCTAADMEAMVWDDKLAADSQAWADGCVAEHAEAAGSDFGENLFMSMPDTSYNAGALASGVQDWYSEIVDSKWGIDDKKGSCAPGKVCGHYWQVVWAKSNRVGCGVAACAKSFIVGGADHGSGVFLVCRYDPPAMLKGEGDTHSQPYIFGKPCAACPDHCSNGLCTAPPTRCLDKLGGDNTITIGNTKYDSCQKLVKDYPSDSQMPWCTQLASMMSAEDTCELSCGKCTVPAGVGKEYCDGQDNAESQEEDADKAEDDSTDANDGKPKDADESDSNAKDDDNDDEEEQDTSDTIGQENEESDDDEAEQSEEKGDAKAKMKEQMKAKMKKKMEGKGKGGDDGEPSDAESGNEDEGDSDGELEGDGDGGWDDGDWGDWHGDGDDDDEWFDDGGDGDGDGGDWGSEDDWWNLKAKKHGRKHHLKAKKHGQKHHLKAKKHGRKHRQ